MKIWILTLFPKIFQSVFSESIVKKAQDKKILKINLVDIRNFAEGKHKTVDDKPYGGGKGMVLKVNVIMQALESIKPKPFTILLSANGRKYNQKIAQKFSNKNSIAIICGHYEGVDARVEKFVDEIISIGDFVLTGGEIGAMVITDSITRLLPGVIKKESLEFESFSQLSTFNFQLSTLLEYPQYTKPMEFKRLKVPSVLLSGNHKKIKDWRLQKSLERTKKFRPDLLKTRS